MPPGTPIRRPSRWLRSAGGERSYARHLGPTTPLLAAPRDAAVFEGRDRHRSRGGEEEGVEKSTSMSRTARPGRSTCPPCP
jgi:hypothetical protein